MLHKARHSIISSAKTMAQRLSNDWFSQRFIDDQTQNSNRSLECPLSKSLFLSHECRILQQDQALLDVLDHALANHSNMPDDLVDSLSEAESSHYIFWNLDYEQNKSFFRNPFSKRGYF